ncbi:MAG: hypothetical protein U5K51_12235 [Flavobacteriaceae bacterium]|nr:hypothetical protein [Flavobacteriaceae bacterium]
MKIEGFDSHSVMLAVKPYALPDLYWEAVMETNETIKKVFHENNIKFAYDGGVELGVIGE